MRKSYECYVAMHNLVKGFISILKVFFKSTLEGRKDYAFWLHIRWHLENGCVGEVMHDFSFGQYNYYVSSELIR